MAKLVNKLFGMDFSNLTTLHQFLLEKSWGDYRNKRRLNCEKVFCENRGKNQNSPFREKEKSYSKKNALLRNEGKIQTRENEWEDGNARRIFGN